MLLDLLVIFVRVLKFFPPRRRCRRQVPVAPSLHGCGAYLMMVLLYSRSTEISPPRISSTFPAAMLRTS